LDGLGNVMTWDAESRMTSVAGATYIYDAEGNRVEKQGVGVTDTYYFGGRPLARYAAGQWTDLIYGPTGLLAEVPGTQTGAPVYRVTDHLGATVGNLLANGSFVNPSDYTPFGQTFSGGTNDPYIFTGKERDAESGLDYFGARYYGSNMGRWPSPDPSGLAYANPMNPQSLNLYAYVLNNPLVFVDPLGLATTCVITTTDTYTPPSAVVDGNGSGVPTLRTTRTQISKADCKSDPKKPAAPRKPSRTNQIVQCASKKANEYSLAGLFGWTEEGEKDEILFGSDSRVA
jgi:RHS repeat-associated protein